MQAREHLHILKVPFQVPVSPDIKLDRFVNILLVYGKSEVVLVDSGVAGAEEQIFSYLAETGRKPGDLKKMLLSHSHPDHLGAARSIQQETGCLIHAHPAEKEWIEDTGLQGRERPVPGFNNLVGGSVKVDVLLEDGAKMAMDPGITIEIIHTPGHSPGSVSLHIPGDSAVFTADAIPLPGDLPIFTDWQASVDSLARLQALADSDLVLSSWAEPTRGPQKDEILARGLDWLYKILITTKVQPQEESLRTK